MQRNDKKIILKIFWNSPIEEMKCIQVTIWHFAAKKIDRLPETYRKKETFSIYFIP